MDTIADPNLPLLVSRSCTWTAEALGRISPDKHRPDVYDKKSTYCHALDALRYFLVNQAVGQQEWIDIDYGDGTSPRSRDSCDPHPHHVDELLQAAQLGQLGR